MARKGEKDWRVDIGKFPRRATIDIISRKKVVGDAALAAEVFADEYRDDMSALSEEEMPPCIYCTDKMIYFCYMTSVECRKWRVWDDTER